MLWDIRHEEEFSVAEKWIKDAIKKPGALRKAMGVKEGEKIPVSELKEKKAQLQRAAEGDKKLSKSQRTMLQRVNLALTLRDMK
jgi:hypothetical protein|tara:strand:+ start:889 stop:1140 length:252 start_codon:yes stop_codon:yes gene_type:complete